MMRIIQAVYAFKKNNSDVQNRIEGDGVLKTKITQGNKEESGVPQTMRLVRGKGGNFLLNVTEYTMEIDEEVLV